MGPSITSVVRFSSHHPSKIEKLRLPLNVAIPRVPLASRTSIVELHIASLRHQSTNVCIVIWQETTLSANLGSRANLSTFANTFDLMLLGVFLQNQLYTLIEDSLKTIWVVKDQISTFIGCKTAANPTRGGLIENLCTQDTTTFQSLSSEGFTYPPHLGRNIVMSQIFPVSNCSVQLKLELFSNVHNSGAIQAVDEHHWLCDQCLLRQSF